MTPLSICLAQLNFTVGDIEGNLKRMIQATQTAKSQQADLIVFPELALTSYPPEDLLLRSDLYVRVQSALTQLAPHATDIDILLGAPTQIETQRFNTAIWLRHGTCLAQYHKRMLPNHGVFDEQRYFTAGDTPTLVSLKGVRIGLAICEDLWHPTPIQALKAAGAQCVISMNASPFTQQKAAARLATLRARTAETQLPILYVNHIGGQDDFLFDGGSLALNAAGQCCFHAPFFETGLYTVPLASQTLSCAPQDSLPTADIACLYQALVTGIKDYVNKNQFAAVIIGLSGGIDSALTLAIAVDALGPDRVTAVMMPSQYTADMSQQDAKQQANALGCAYEALSITTLFDAFLTTLAPHFASAPPDVTEENLQARIRGTLLMALANKRRQLVLTTSNKSELAMGYATLYGDMVGGYAVLKDIYKTKVYELAQYRNSLSSVIPERVLTRPPSAELAPNQKDSDTLPDYALLDRVIEAYMEHDYAIDDLVTSGFDDNTIQTVISRIQRNEYKRHQAPPGPRVTDRAFDRSRRYPITNKYLR